MVKNFSGCDRARVAMYSNAALETLIPVLRSSLGQIYTQIALIGRFLILRSACNNYLARKCVVCTSPSVFLFRGQASVGFML